MSKNVEYPGYYNIPHTKLYYKQAPIGVVQNGYDSFMEYLSTKTDDVVLDHTSDQSKRTLRQYCYRLYKLDENGQMQELSTKTPLAIVNQDFSVDDNGNMVLRSYGSDLENVMMSGGDMLVSASGEVLRETKGQMFIHEADAFGYYPVDVFVSDRTDGKSRIVRIDHNFMDASGKMLTNAHFKNSQDPLIIPVPHTYHGVNDGKLIIDKSVYPTAYVYTDRNGATLFPSATALLIENRRRQSDFPDLPPLVNDESEYLVAHYARKNNFARICKQLEAKGFPSDTLYDATELERVLYGVFDEEYETDADKEFNPNNEKTI